MAIIMPPAPLKLRGIRWRLHDPAQVNRSGWTGTRKVIGLPGAALWSAKGTFVPILGADAADPWIAFFIGLRGQANCFPLIAVERRQTSIANPVVDAGANAGKTLPLAGLPPYATVLGSGMRMSVPLPNGHVRLVVLQAPLVANAVGKAVAVFLPELSLVPTAGATVEIREPYSLVSQTNPESGWDVGAGQLYPFEMEAEEAL